jgi:HD domain
VSEIVHLVKRFGGSLSGRSPDADAERWAESQLLPHELVLWTRLSNADRRHALRVAQRFEQMRGSPSREELAAALLHDIGKLDSGLGTFGRVAATVIGPRTRRFRAYHDHERIGARWLEVGGSADTTVELVQRRGDGAAALCRADDI